MTALGFTELGLKWYFGIGTPTRPTTFWASLHSADPGNFGKFELSLTHGYSRQPQHNWTDESSGLSVRFTSDDSATLGLNDASTARSITHFGVWSDETDGTFYFGAPVTLSPITWPAGNTFGWDARAITFAVSGARIQAVEVGSWLLNVGSPTAPTAFHMQPIEDAFEIVLPIDQARVGVATTFEVEGLGKIKNVNAGEIDLVDDNFFSGLNNIWLAMNVWDTATPGTGTLLFTMRFNNSGITVVSVPVLGPDKTLTWGAGDLQVRLAQAGVGVPLPFP